MSTRTVLFIGGPKDREILRIAGSWSFINLANQNGAEVRYELQEWYGQWFGFVQKHERISLRSRVAEDQFGEVKAFFIGEGVVNLVEQGAVLESIRISQDGDLILVEGLAIKEQD